MEFLKHCLTFIAFYCLFDWLIKKTNVHNKIFNNPRRRKFIKPILVLILIIFIFSLHYGQYELQDRFGKFDIISMVEASFLAVIEVNFGQFIWRKSKKK